MEFQTIKVFFSQTSTYYFLKMLFVEFKTSKVFFWRRKVTEEKLHRDSNCFLMLVIRSKHFFTLSRRSFSILSRYFPFLATELLITFFLTPKETKHGTLSLL